MAQQIKVIDINGNEHYHLIPEDGIYFSNDNDGLYRLSLEDKLDASLSLSQVKDAIFYNHWDLDDLDFDIEDYIYNGMLYDEISVQQHFCDVIVNGGNDWEKESLLKYMRKLGYKIEEPEEK